MPTDIVITSATRTAIGSFLGQFANVPAYKLGAYALRDAMKRSQVAPKDISDVIMGHVLTANCGQNPARQAAIEADIPLETPALTINQVCGSGLRSVALATEAVQADNDKIILAGGQESMSRAPHAIPLRQGKKMGNIPFTDTMIKDGLWCATNGYHMGVTAENVAKKWTITRKEQDAFALLSQQKAEKALTENAFSEEIVAVPAIEDDATAICDTDEYPRKGVSEKDLARLKPAFDKDGSVTAGNASGLNDGAAAICVMSADNARKRKLTPLARIVSWATCGVDPALMGIGPVPATKKALAMAGWTIKDVDLVEANEAFAAQSCAVIKELALNPDIVNVHGGAIALGHPIGASGARVLVTLLYAMKKHNAKKGLATLCIGGGMGIAMCIERPSST
ncbi:MAG: acetyl-CoA C-acetyltransferase [Alphaproteobacteria bacterium GM7ARS4]|nr:acetyl-CoA C-acetyltransferase [Alphaproteobacteria bacterium GM7ARS4]